MLHGLGRLDELHASGQLDTVLKSLGRLSDKLLVLDAHARGESVTTQTVTVGPALIVDRLWRECGHGHSRDRLKKTFQGRPTAAEARKHHVHSV